MFDIKWHRRHLRIAREVSTWSKDPSTGVSAIVVNPDKEPVTWNYNGFPRTMEDRDEWLVDRDEKISRIVHAEENAVLGRNVRGCVMYTSLFPCSGCSRLIAASGIVHVISPEIPEDKRERWGKSFEITRKLLRDSKVSWTIYKSYLLDTNEGMLGNDPTPYIEEQWLAQ